MAWLLSELNRHLEVLSCLEIDQGFEAFLMSIHKRILEWQAAHPTVTWVGWGIVWAIVFILLLWPQSVD